MVSQEQARKQGKDIRANTQILENSIFPFAKFFM